MVSMHKMTVKLEGGHEVVFEAETEERCILAALGWAADQLTAYWPEKVTFEKLSE